MKPRVKKQPITFFTSSKSSVRQTPVDGLPKSILKNLQKNVK